MSDNPKFTQLKTAMLLYCPFFASLLLDKMHIHVGKFPDKFPKGNETAATDGATIWIDEDYLDKLTLPEAVFLVCHEVGHAMWLHMPRYKAYADSKTSPVPGEELNHKRWNYAGDYIINDMLIQSGIGKMPQGGLHDSRYTYDMGIDDVYRLIDDPPNNGGDGGFDHHIPADGNVTEAEWKRSVASAAEAAKAQGKLPGTLERFVEEFLEPKVAWEEKLRNKLTKVLGRDAVTWSKINRRRYVAQGVILPGYTGYGCGTVVYMVDTSGSMGKAELVQGLSECDKIMDDCKPEELIIIGIDAAVHDVTHLYQGDSLADNMPPLKGGGGTSFKPGFEWLDEQGIIPDAVVYFTDMMGDFPEEPAYPVIWCNCYDKETEAPFGETIHVEVGESHA